MNLSSEIQANVPDRTRKGRIYIIKANRQRVPFDPRKVETTCIRAGANKKLASLVAEKVREQIYEGMTTREIYKLVLSELSIEDQSQTIKHRYRLKEAIMLMGPAGFRFENYVSRILENYGHKIKSIRAAVQGRCIKHELDIVTYHGSTKKRYFVECKYHNSPGIFTGVKESLYTHARFLDLQDSFDGELLICNTKVSTDVITYGRCIGQTIISWRYPAQNSLEKMIEDKGLYPITILGLSNREMHVFSQNNIILARDLLIVDVGQLSKIDQISQLRLERFQSIVRQML